jgi:dihydroneopterin aldolase / 2-amino-4-hydroxy-6-hydroxymethyldihydropteridine diphosphokinase
VAGRRVGATVPAGPEEATIPTDRIKLTGIRAVGTIGVLPEEQSRAQPFEVDLVIEFDARLAGEKDDLDASVNYAVPIEIVQRIITEEQHLLLERVATRICEDVLALRGVDAVDVVVKKLRPPVPQDIVSTAVRLRRRRPDLVRFERPLSTAYVALGSNLGDREENLRFAVEHLPGLRTLSGLYETDPVGGPDDQGPYLNMVAEVETRLDPFALLSACRRIEAGAGRERKVRWGPRTLDLDVLLYDDVRIDSAELTVPHPRMWERRFVLAPLAEIAPHRVPTDWDMRLPAGGVWRVGELER